MHSIVPIEVAFARLWPQPLLMNLQDDSLSADLERDGGLTPAMTDGFLRLSDYAVATGCDGILFTCSAFDPLHRRGEGPSSRQSRLETERRDGRRPGSRWADHRACRHLRHRV
jgi:hypothetical protein